MTRFAASQSTTLLGRIRHNRTPFSIHRAAERAPRVAQTNIPILLHQLQLLGGISISWPRFPSLLLWIKGGRYDLFKIIQVAVFVMTRERAHKADHNAFLPRCNCKAFQRHGGGTDNLRQRRNPVVRPSQWLPKNTVDNRGRLNPIISNVELSNLRGSPSVRCRETGQFGERYTLAFSSICAPR